MTQEEAIQVQRIERDYKAISDICNLLIRAQICAKHFDCETEQCEEIRKYIVDSVETTTEKIWAIYRTWIEPYHIVKFNK
jgi:hypothetical protein